MKVIYIFALVLSISSCSMSNGAEQAAGRYYEAMKENNVDVMKSLLDDTKWFSITPGTNIGLKDYELGEATIDGESATIQTIIISDSGFRGEFDTVLVKNNNDWFVSYEKTLKNKLEAARKAKKIEMNMEVKINPVE
jgi:hypothetical protein